MGMRSFAERLSRGLVLRRRLPPQFGDLALHVSPDASLRFWRRTIAETDPQLLANCEELVTRGSCVWDIGANIGLFTFGAAWLAGDTGSVLAVEADLWLVELLRRSAAGVDSRVAPVEILHAAASDQEGEAAFVIARRGRATNHLARVDGSSQSGGGRAVVRVPTVTLDGLRQGRRDPDLLKVDVEGAEALCLAGGRTLLGTIRPVLLCEVTSEGGSTVARTLAEATT